MSIYVDVSRADQIFSAFAKFHRDNPKIWELFQKYSLEAWGAGHAHYSSKAIFERIRWHVQVETRGGELKLNNNFTAYYARMFHLQHPLFTGFFRLRKLISSAASGYENDQQEFVSSPPGEEERALTARLLELLEEEG